MLFSALLYYRDLAVVDFNKITWVIMVFSIAIILEPKHIIYLLCFLFPLSCGIPCNYIYPLLITLLLIKRKRITFNKMIFFIIVLLIEIAHYGVYTFAPQVAEVVGFASFLFMLSYFIADDTKSLDHSKCLIYFCIGVGVLLLGLVLNYSLLASQMGPAEDVVRLGENRELGEFQESRMMLSTNANNIGYYSIAAISCLLVLQYYRKINGLLFLILFAISFYGGVLSVSRTWALLMVMSIITYLILMKKDRFKGLFLIGALCIGALIFISKNQLVLEFFTDRFIGDINNLSTAGGRTMIFQQYNEYLAQNPSALIWGTGAIYYREIAQVEFATHNALQQILVSYGVLGLCLFIFAFIKSVKHNFNLKEKMSILPLVMMALFVQSIQILNPYFLMCPIIIAFFALKMCKGQNELS